LIMIKDIRDIDFWSEFLREGSDFYGDIYSIDQSAFNSFVVENFILIAKIKSLDEVIPNKDELQNLVEKGYEHRCSQCHYSSKAIAIVDESYEYWTGFIYRNDSIYPVLTHSFNIKNRKVIDFSKVRENGDLIELVVDPNLPHWYYGIHIPTNFVSKYRDQVFKEESMNPLLYEWLKQQGL